MGVCWCPEPLIPSLSFLVLETVLGNTLGFVTENDWTVRFRAAKLNYTRRIEDLSKERMEGNPTKHLQAESWRFELETSVFPMESRFESLFRTSFFLLIRVSKFNQGNQRNDPAACRFSSQTTAASKWPSNESNDAQKSLVNFWAHTAVISCDRFDILMEESGSSAGHRQRRRTSTIGVIPIPKDFSVLHRSDVARNST